MQPFLLINFFQKDIMRLNVKHIFIPFLFLLACSKPNDENKTVAQVDDYKISVASFARSYLKDLQFSPVDVQDNFEQRKNHIDKMITAYFLAKEAVNAGFDTTLIYKNLMKTESASAMIHGLYEKEIQQTMEPITPEEIEEAFKRQHTKLDLSHLVSHTKAGIDSLYNRLQKGESFENLAKECFKNPVFKENGGDLGMVQWGDLEWDFENAAYSLNIGEISKPVESKYGWHIIRLNNKIVNPILREMEFNTRKKSIEQQLYNRLLKHNADLRIKKMMSEKNIKMNLPLIVLFEKERRNIKDKKLNPDYLEKEKTSFQNIFDKYHNENIAVYDGGAWTVEQFFKYLYTVSPNALGKGMYSAVAMSLRNYFLLDIAKNKKVQKDEKVQNILAEKRTEILASLFFNNYVDSYSLSQKDYESFYTNIKRKYYFNPDLHVLEILLKNEQQAWDVIKELKAGDRTEKTFRNLAEKYTQRKGFRQKQGDLGDIKKSDMGEIGKAAFKLSKGGMTGPVKNKDGFSILFLADINELYIPFNQVQDQVITQLEKQKKDYLYNLVLDKYSNNPQVVVKDFVLKNCFN